jgi:hypothetical protein
LCRRSKLPATHTGQGLESDRVRIRMTEWRRHARFVDLTLFAAVKGRSVSATGSKITDKKDVFTVVGVDVDIIGSIDVGVRDDIVIDVVAILASRLERITACRHCRRCRPCRHCRPCRPRRHRWNCIF